MTLRAKGFTLLEAIVALAVVALVVAAALELFTAQAMVESRVRSDLRLATTALHLLEEAALEPSGAMPQSGAMDGLSWELTTEIVENGPVATVERLTVIVRGPDGGAFRLDRLIAERR